jgi:class 3 adenylate cyclase
MCYILSPVAILPTEVGCRHGHDPPTSRVLAADVAGYSRLMGLDEEGTHERLRAHLAELVHPKIGEHRGRVVKNTGDGFLAEFASVVDRILADGSPQRDHVQ